MLRHLPIQRHVDDDMYDPLHSHVQKVFSLHISNLLVFNLCANTAYSAG
jgi:hypothetical protein